MTAAEHTANILPYRGLGTGILGRSVPGRRLTWIDERDTNQFRAVLWRPVTPDVAGEVMPRPESQPESLELRVLRVLRDSDRGKAEVSAQLGQKEVSGQLNKIMRELLANGAIAYTIPDKPNSRLQKYRLTEQGRAVLAEKNQQESKP